MMQQIYKQPFYFNVPPEMHSMAFYLHSYPDWEWSAFNFYRALMDPEKIFIDVGAWNGCTAVYCSKLFKEVISVECDPISVQDYKNIMQANSITNYTLIELPIYHSITEVNFALRGGWNSSMSGINNGINAGIKLQSTTLLEILKSIDVLNIGLLKIDIEGGEENILKDLNQISGEVPIYLSIHRDWFGDLQNINMVEPILEKYQYIYGTRYDELIEDEIVVILTEPMEFIKKFPFTQLLLSNKELDQNIFVKNGVVICPHPNN